MRAFICVLCVLCVLGVQELQAKTFKVVLADIPPYAINKGGAASGILVDVTRKAFNALGHDVRFYFYPWPRAVKSIQMGEADAITPFFLTPEREKFASFIGRGVVDMELMFFKRQDNPINISTLEEARPYKIVKVRRANLGVEFSRYVEEGILDIEPASNSTLAVKKLEANRVDFMANVKHIALYKINELGLEGKVVEAGQPFGKLKAYLAFSRKTMKTDMCQKVADKIEELRTQGELQKIFANYGL